MQGVHFPSRGSDPVPRSPKDHPWSPDGSMPTMPLCPMTEECLRLEETLTEGTQGHHMSSLGLGYCICLLFCLSPSPVQRANDPRPFLEEASVEARNLLTTFVEFIGTEVAWKLLMMTKKDWACWVKFGLPTSVNRHPQEAATPLGLQTYMYWITSWPRRALHLWPNSGLLFMVTQRPDEDHFQA